MSAAAFGFYRDAILQTIGIASASLVIALAAGAPLALAIVRGGIAGRAIGAVVAVVRAIPDLVLAVVAVVALGFGPAAGVAALSLHYAAVIAKLVAETLGGVRREGAEALRATGATGSTALLVGMLPAAWPGIVGFGAYAFESIVRASVIVGVVGAGGIGAIIIQQLNLADYRGVGVSVGLLVALVVAVDTASAQLRRSTRPVFVLAALAGLAAVGGVAFALTADPPWRAIVDGPAHVLAFLVSAWPPTITVPVTRVAAAGVGVTLGVAVAGTLGGAVLALLPAWLAAAAARSTATLRTVARREAALSALSRGLLSVLRALPPIAVALVGLSLVGLGPPAAIFALVIHTTGVLGKLVAESLELAERAPAQALVATGATPAAATLVALVPTAAAVIWTHVLYRFEWNVRASTILGMVGAGGLGQAIFNEQQLLHYHALASYVLVAVALVLAIDAGLGRFRARFYLAGLTR